MRRAVGVREKVGFVRGFYVLLRVDLREERLVDDLLNLLRQGFR